LIKDIFYKFENKIFETAIKFYLYKL